MILPCFKDSNPQVEEVFLMGWVGMSVLSPFAVLPGWGKGLGLAPLSSLALPFR